MLAIGATALIVFFGDDLAERQEVEHIPACLSDPSQPGQGWWPLEFKESGAHYELWARLVTDDIHRLLPQEERAIPSDQATT